MPIVFTDYGSGDGAALSRGRTMTAAGEVQQGLKADLSRGRTMTAAGSVELAPDFTGAFSRGRTLTAFGRVNDEANVFGAASFARGRTMNLLETPTVNGAVKLQRGRSSSAVGQVGGTHAGFFQLLVHVVGQDSGRGFGSPGFADLYTARITTNGGAQAFAIKSFNMTDSADEVGVGLEMVLLRPSDRAAIQAAADFKFEIFASDEWTVRFDSGKRSGSGFSYSWQEGRPADTLSVSTISPMSAQLDRSPPNNRTIYDSERETLRVEDFRPLFDDQGERYDHELEPIAGLTLWKLFEAVFVDKCGFDEVKTTIPNFPVRRCDFNVTSTYLQGVAGHIGAFLPYIFVKQNTLWILDGTSNFPNGFGVPVPLKSDAYIDVQLNDVELDADGYLVQYADDDSAYDYTTTRTEDDDTDPAGVIGAPNYTETNRSRTFRDYWKNATPLVPVRSEKIKDITVIKAYIDGSFGVQSTDTETTTLDSYARVKKISRTLIGVVPSLLGETYENATIKTTITTFSYVPDYTNPRRQILRQKQETVSGLMVTDEDNLHLGKPFRQDFAEALAAGNLSDGLVISSGPIRTVTERTTQTPKGQHEIKTTVIDFLSNPPQISYATTDARGGDGSLNGATSATIDRIVLRPGTVRSDPKLIALPVMEIPWEVAQPLALRRLRRRLRRGTVTMLGVKPLEKGMMFQLFDRNDAVIGNFLITGQSLAGSDLGTGRQRTRHVIEVQEI